MWLVIHKLIRVIRDYAVISCEIDAHKSHLIDWLTPKLKQCEQITGTHPFCITVHIIPAWPT